MKLDATLVATLSRWLDATDIDGLELSGPEGALTLGRAGAARIADAAPRQAAAPVAIAAPSPGVFLDRHPLAAHPFAETGDEVAEGEPLACLQVGALLIPVRAPGAGIVAERLAEPGTLVGYGTPLFRLHSLAHGEPA
ncbi:acetyl-CoA carboxylase biotin carboxyl carrier protein [Falsiroseomonas sp. HW251]|uniref:acetyl-CoA carboxylase biotin carboxyl carrier protein n=1 Tax=Falsiroseomonas sp. HW251 TaxID=3390998 RepID=UPI003D31B2CD